MSEVSGRSGAATSDAPSKPLKTDVMAPNVWPQPVPTLRSTDVCPENKKKRAHMCESDMSFQLQLTTRHA